LKELLSVREVQDLVEVAVSDVSHMAVTPHSSEMDSFITIAVVPLDNDSRLPLLRLQGAADYLENADESASGYLRIT